MKKLQNTVRRVYSLPMNLGILLFSIIGFIAVVSYKKRGLEVRVISNIPLIDWINILVVPILGYAGIALIVSNIISRPRREIIDFEDFPLLVLGVLFLIYAFVGNSIHFVGKVLSRYIGPRKHNQIYRINEVFHGKLSHYLGMVCTALVFYVICLIELNHPLVPPGDNLTLYIVIAMGILTGFSAMKVIFYTSGWFGGYNRPIFLLVSVLMISLFLMTRNLQLVLSSYPLTIFVITSFGSVLIAFILRRFLIMTRLSRRRGFRIFAKLLSG